MIHDLGQLPFRGLSELSVVRRVDFRQFKVSELERNHMTTQPDIHSPERLRFNESIGIDDPCPFTGWVPSPRQIQEWSAVIRAERDGQAGVTRNACVPIGGR